MFRKIYLPLLSVLLVLLGSCNTGRFAKGSKHAPDWVRQRPVNSNFYIGIGYAAKKTNPQDYPRVAKRNAMEELSGEIKVSISTNSLLSQNQINQNYSQQFISDTRMNTSEALEGYEVAGSWEDKENYWIYYRLSKVDYELLKRRKREEASEKAVDLLNRARGINLSRNFVQAFQLRVRAIIALQNYLNEPMEVNLEGRRVFLLNEILAQLQQQLLSLQIHIEPEQFHAISGGTLNSPILTRVQLQQPDSLCEPVAYLPLRLEGSQTIRFRGNAFTQTQTNGLGQFQISSIQSKETLQLLQVKPDLEQLMGSDSITPALKQLISQLSVPLSLVKLRIEPIRIFLVSKERNLDKQLPYLILEPILKKELTRMGCAFVPNPEQADYRLELDANTRDLGVIWGNMLKAGIQMSLVLKDSRNDSEIHKDAIDNLIGYQITPEKAGMDAYQLMGKTMMEKTIPLLEKKLFYGE